MPKIIENLQNNILDEARRIIDEKGADALSMRNLANRLGIAPSTLYNYYESKEQLMGALLKRSWAEALAEIDEICSRQTEGINKETPEKEGSNRADPGAGAQCNDEPGTEDRSIQALAEMVTVLRRTIRPLLQQHISQVVKKEEKPRFNINTVVFEPLRERVQLILEGTGRSKEDAKAMAQVLMKLLVTCMFDMELDLVEVLETAGKLPSRPGSRNNPQYRTTQGKTSCQEKQHKRKDIEGTGKDA